MSGLAAESQLPCSMHSPLNWFMDQLKSKQLVNKEKVCFVLLNSELYGMEHFIRRHWNSFVFTACADGGSNTLFDHMGEERHRFIPNLICGDLDSARPEVLKYYKDKGSDVVQYTDQDTSDFRKVLDHLLTLRKDTVVEFTSVYVLNALWGRFDQTMGNLGTLYSIGSVLDDFVRVYLMSEDSLVFILKPGTSVISVDSGLEEGHCGLIPIGETCNLCTTTGLTWNLDGQSLQMTGLISTSNIIVPDVKQVTVSISNPLVWTMSHTLRNSA